MVDMLAGGLATTTFLLAGIGHFLATHPEDAARLAADPSLHQNAVEEIIRYYASVLALGRTATKDTEIQGQPIKKGEMVMLSYAVAARDPRYFENPHKIDIDRKIPTNPAFGYGPHRCIGSHLARLQGTTAMAVLLERLKDLRLAPGTDVLPLHGDQGPGGPARRVHPGRPGGERLVKFVVDSALCNGHGQCCAVAPDVYDLDDDGLNAAAGTVAEVPAGHEEAARAGASACPESAIQVVA